MARFFSNDRMPRPLLSNSAPQSLLRGDVLSVRLLREFGVPREPARSSEAYVRKPVVQISVSFERLLHPEQWTAFKINPDFSLEQRVHNQIDHLKR